MNCIIIGGFLGSGKTTFINRLLKTAESAGLPGGIALLINEFGEIPVDGVLIDSGSCSVQELTGGCICCSLKGLLSDAVADIRERIAPDLLLIEATGLAVPSEIAATIGAAGGCSVHTLLCIDPEQYRKLAGHLAIYDRQLGDSELVLLTKSDIRSDSLINSIGNELESGGMFRECFNSSEEAVSFLFAGAEDSGESPESELQTVVPEAAHNHSGHSDKHDICETTHRFGGPLDMDVLRRKLAAIAEKAGSDMFRIKGIVQTKDGWMAVQFVDGELAVKGVEPANDESFIVFIGRCGIVEGIEI